MSGERKRPWYLVLALLGALALGTTGAYAGWVQVASYHAVIDPAADAEDIADAHDHALVQSRAEEALQALDAAKPRGWPLAVATLLLGGATLFFAARAIGGSGGARAALVQLVLAQAGVGVASHVLLRDVMEADLRFIAAKQAAEEHEDGRGTGGPTQPTATMLRAANTAALVLRTLGSVLVVIGLTRRRSRDFFDAAPAPVEEQ